MDEALKAIALSDDVSVVRAFEFLHTTLLNGLSFPASELLEQLETLPGFGASLQPLISHLHDNAGVEVSPQQSISLARLILVAWTENPDTAGLVLHCIENWPDDRQSVGKTIALGVIGTVWLLAATTEVLWKDGKLTIHKKAMVPQQIEATADTLRQTLSIRVHASDRTQDLDAASRSSSTAAPSKHP